MTAFQEIFADEIEEKIEAKAKEIAINLLKKFFDPEVIAETTGLSLDKIIELKRQLKDN